MNFEEALQLARHWHGDQTDKTGADYVTGHLKRVGWNLYAAGRPEHLVVAGALHDILEDTACAEVDLIAAGVTPESIEIIQAVTRPAGLTYPEFIDWVIGAGQEAIALKLADVEDNLDEDRLNKLPTKTSDRLRGKYGPARRKLEGALK